jgi:hypothetical protein
LEKQHANSRTHKLGSHMSYLFIPVFKKDKEWKFIDPSLEKNEQPLGGSRENGPRDWNFAYKMLFNARCLGTSMAAPSVSHLYRSGAVVYKREGLASRKVKVEEGTTKERAHGQGENPPVQRWRFVFRQSLILLGRYIALCVYYDPVVYHYMLDGTAWNHGDFSPEKEAFFRRLIGSIISSDYSPITTREINIRLHYVLDRIIPDYFVLSSYHDILAIVAVAIRLDDPQEWPPLFGNITEAYTIRRYWSHFWHHLIYRSFSAWSSLITTQVFQLKRKHSRYINNALVFILSGLMHALVEWKLAGPRCGYWSLGYWFLMQIGGVVVEEVLQNVWAAVETQILGIREGEQAMWLRRVKVLIGYLWVIGWMFYSVPKFLFAKLYCLS